jgi:hypothetical protein
MLHGVLYYPEAHNDRFKKKKEKKEGRSQAGAESRQHFYRRLKRVCDTFVQDVVRDGHG